MILSGTPWSCFASSKGMILIPKAEVAWPVGQVSACLDRVQDCPQIPNQRSHPYKQTALSCHSDGSLSKK